MLTLTEPNIESELSYAYLHAVASRAGMGCKVGSRHDDNAGIDAEITAWAPFPNGGFLKEVDLKVQLKATTQPATIVGDYFSYSLAGIGRYDDLRCEAVSSPRILVVLYLPQESKEWLAHSEEELLLRKCAYWVSLRGAEASTNKTAQTVYLPKSQKFDVESLKNIAAILSRCESLIYKGRDGA